MKNNLLLKVVSCGFASVSFTVCLLVWGQLVGFKDGARWGGRPGNEVIRDAIVISKGIGSTAYDSFVMSYSLIAACLYVFMIAKLFERSTVSRAVSVIPLGVIIYKYWQLFQWKELYLHLNADFGYYYWIMQSIPFDWFCAITTTILLAVQIFIIFISYISSPNNL